MPSSTPGSARSGAGPIVTDNDATGTSGCVSSLTYSQRQLNLDAMKGDRVPTLDELAAAVRAGTGEAATRLRAAIELGRELTDLGDALIGRFVAEARTAGLSWTEIGHLFGTSKQAVQQRYGATTGDAGDWPGR